jgi:hypothetical protein
MNLSYLEVIIDNRSASEKPIELVDEVKKINFDADKMNKDAKYRAFAMSILEENKDRLISMCVVQRCEGQFIG